MRTARVLALLSLWACGAPTSAHADWLLSPFIGVKFAGHTNLVEFDGRAGANKLTVGASTALLSDGIFGVEGDVAYVSRFFEQGDDLIARSSVTTLTGNVMVAVPRSITRESLRPYLVSGLGLMHVGIDDVLGLLPIDSNLLCLDVGGGAIGAVTNRVSVRFEVRHFRNLSAENNQVVGFGNTRLNFWRGTVGVFLRY